MKLHLDTNSLADYRLMLQIKRLPVYRFIGQVAEFPDEYASRLRLEPASVPEPVEYVPHPQMFDYQQDIAKLAIEKRKFAIFVRPGLGKTLCEVEFARHAAASLPLDRRVLIFAPPLVVRQMAAEIRRFYGDSLAFTHLTAKSLPDWLAGGAGERIGLTNYEALKKDTTAGCLGGLVCDESHIFASHYGVWGRKCIELGRGLEWKLSATGTPAPNDQIEYGNHAVFLDHFPTVNSFLARYFINRGETNQRWELKPHALEAFYRSLSHWAIFVNDPSTYGWKDNVGTIPPVHVHIHDVDMTDEQVKLTCQQTGMLFPTRIGGIVSRANLSGIAKGRHKWKKVSTLKPGYIKELVDSWPDESTIIWCMYDHEQDGLAEIFPDAANISGKTKMERRLELIDEFTNRRRRVLISKTKVMGFGLNLQVATRHIFSGLQDSYLSFHQAICRSNRVGSTQPLNVHIPITDIERPMIETVLRKARRVQEDTETQEKIFKQCREPAA